jgi:hypothetical protein
VIALPGGAQGAVAVGWATVELDRAAAELSHLIAVGAGFSPAPSSPILGARCRSAPAAEAGLWIALLEPDTEGRLAGTLARSGEGWAATWVLTEATEAAAATEATSSQTLSAARPGPFGIERLVLGGPLTGPHRIVLEAVPSPP